MQLAQLHSAQLQRLSIETCSQNRLPWQYSSLYIILQCWALLYKCIFSFLNFCTMLHKRLVYHPSLILKSRWFALNIFQGPLWPMINHFDATRNSLMKPIWIIAIWEIFIAEASCQSIIKSKCQNTFIK